MNAMDFSDLQLQTWILFQRFPEILEKWQRRAAHLLVDEYQDTNRVQYLIVKALAGAIGKSVRGRRRRSIDLSMARRRHPQHPRFRARLPGRANLQARAELSLDENYPCAAGGVIRNNTERKIKNLWTENGAGEPVTYYTGVTERDEADFIALEIARLTGSGGFRPADVVVFYRVNAQSRAIEEALVRRRIPYYVVGGVRFYEQRDVKDLLAYLRVLANPADAVSLERMVGTPPRGIGAKSFEAITELAAPPAHHGVRGDGPPRNVLQSGAQNCQAGRDALFVDARSRRAHSGAERARDCRGSRRAQRFRGLPRHPGRRDLPQAESRRDALRGKRLRRREIRRRLARVPRARRPCQ